MKILSWLLIAACVCLAACGDGQTPPQLSPKRYADKCGYIDYRGRLLIEPQFDEAYPFSEGLAAVRIGDSRTGLWGYINKRGKLVIPPQFSEVWNFSEGLARVGYRENNLWGYIDKKGRLVITPQFEKAGNFSGGRATVTYQGREGSIDRNGTFTEP